MSTLLDGYLRWADRLAGWGGAFAAVCLLVMAVLMLSEVVARSFFADSLTFSWEFSGYLMGATFFFGAGYALRTGGHVRVGLLGEALPENAARWLDLGATVVGLGVTAIIFAALLELASISLGRQVVSFTPTRTPLVIPQGLIALGSLLLLLQLVARLIRLLRAEPPEIRPAYDRLPER